MMSTLSAIITALIMIAAQAQECIIGEQGWRQSPFQAPPWLALSKARGWTFTLNVPSIDVTNLRFDATGGDHSALLSLWDVTAETRLAITFASFSTGGWQSVTLPAAVTLTQGSTYAVLMHGLSSSSFYMYMNSTVSNAAASQGEPFINSAAITKVENLLCGPPDEPECPDHFLPTRTDTAATYCVDFCFN